jgi:hypothetical protein
MQGPLPEAARKACRSNLQLASTARSLQLLINDRDYDKRANGVNAKLENALVGDFDAPRELKQERHYHRTFINMASAGYTTTEIAQLTGFSKHTVTICLRQPWARKFLINEAKKTVTDQIREVLEKQALPSIELLVKVRDDTNARNTDRLSASQQLLDRFLGKAAQPIITQEKPPEQLTNDEINARANAILSRFGNTEGAPGAAAD